MNKLDNTHRVSAYICKNIPKDMSEINVTVKVGDEDEPEKSSKKGKKDKKSKKGKKAKDSEEEEKEEIAGKHFEQVGLIDTIFIEFVLTKL
jgi:hypothetical protein